MPTSGSRIRLELATSNWPWPSPTTPRMAPPESPTTPPRAKAPVRQSTCNWHLATGRGSSRITPRTAHSPHPPTTPEQGNLRIANPLATRNGQTQRLAPTAPRMVHSAIAPAQANLQFANPLPNWQPAAGRGSRPNHSSNGTHTPLTHCPGTNEHADPESTGNCRRLNPHHSANGILTLPTHDSGTSQPPVPGSTCDGKFATGPASRLITPRMAHSPNSPVTPDKPTSSSRIRRRLATGNRRCLWPHHSRTGHPPKSPTTPAQAGLQFANPLATDNWQLATGHGSKLMAPRTTRPPHTPTTPSTATSRSRIHRHLSTGNCHCLRPDRSSKRHRPPLTHHPARPSL
jgi:hypothetical protein